MDLCYIRKCLFRKYCLNLQQKSDMTALAVLGSMEGQCYFEKSWTCNDTLLII